ncbi:hypothetical protein TIFTF001_051255 [Ficus carica]|uniref:Uncharacterized protein n=1 Tax=Ficus carica TaxID=3494 RepID=A0AA87YV70_FICCA|nr:hypothetical protein TIFTF001_051255 [Ficus carica]
MFTNIKPPVVLAERKLTSYVYAVGKQPPAISDAILWRAGSAGCEMWDGHCHGF